MTRGAETCADLVRRQDRDRYLLAMLAPPERRPALLALYAMATEAARVPGLVSEPMLGVIRLQYWRDLVTADDPAAAARGNPVAEALAATVLVDVDTAGRALLVEHLEGWGADLAPEAPPDEAAARRQAAATAGALAEASARLLGAREADSLTVARHVGTAWGLVAVARATPGLLAHGRLRLPLDALRAAGRDARTVLAGADAERIGIRAGVAALVALADTELAAATAAVRGGPVERAARPALRQAVQARRILAALRRAGCDPFDGRLARVPPPLTALVWDRLRWGA
ncbi:squalene/phytoene synthase family protein [Roseospira goensis]|uniref:Phytoene synthase n=1 Tax=Roseospira goensis TaxID=391922 RepID=A0A7W6WLI2_9PROT|nr:squalene/phytoene synthase family protein [Roseospira goensis]MBB4286859.1 phytoene synthase [Roseospira goensis]